MTESVLVTIVDDDESMREALPELIGDFGFAVRAFASSEEFLAAGCADETSCLVLDIAMPGMSGPQLQQELKRRGQSIPIIFITAHGDAASFAPLLERGASACLIKPFSDTALLDAIKAALRLD
jgi:FixJ family two-component response regulator